MGLLAQRFAEVRSVRDFLTEDDDAGMQTPSGVRVTASVALSLTTVWRCIDLLTSAVSQAPKDVIVKVGGQSFEEFTKPSWLVTPNPTDPTYTINDYFAQVALSLLIDGNYFVRVVPDVMNPIALIVLPPARVKVKPGPAYDVMDSTGTVVATLRPEQMLHGTWIRPPGELRGISPLESLRRSIGSAVAAEDFGGRFFGQGATLSFGVEVPYAMDATKKDSLRDALRRRHQGLGNSHAIGILSDGAKFVPNLAPTPEQAQMLATRKFSVEDLCRPYGVPPAMAGSTEPGAASFASTEQYDLWYRQGGVLPLATRIESQHDRLLSVPLSLTGTDATSQLKFNLDAVARTSILARFQAYEVGVRGGFLKPDEARGKEDLPPVPGGDMLYMQQQMVPLSDLGKTKATEPLETQPHPAGAQRSLEPFQPIINVTLADGAMRSESSFAPPNIVVTPPDVRVESPVTISPGAVQYHAAPITVEQPDVIVPVSEQRSVRKTVERDDAGRITAITEEPA